MDTKTVFVSIVGKPNVGKSSLVNGLVGKKVSIVSNRLQTTRNRIAGVLTQGSEQIVFQDTPGFLKNVKSALDSKMEKALSFSLVDVDVVLMVVEPTSEVSLQEKNLIERLKKLKVPVILVVNKADLLKNVDDVNEIYEAYLDLFEFSSKFLVSAISSF